MESNPLPLPQGMTTESLEGMLITEGPWRKSEFFVCRHCLGPLYYHPYTNQFWGCKTCGFTAPIKESTRFIVRPGYEPPTQPHKGGLSIMASEPLPIPGGMTKEAIDALMVTEGPWRQSDDFVCVTCGKPAFYHPYTNEIWGCKKCGFTTYTVSLSFHQKATVKEYFEERRGMTL